MGNSVKQFDDANIMNQLFQERLSERALKSRWNVLLFSIITFVYLFTGATITQFAFLKIEMDKELSHEFFGWCLFAMLNYHFFSFIYLAFEGNHDHKLSRRMYFFDEMKQVADGVARYSSASKNNLGSSPFATFKKEYQEAKENVEKSISRRFTRYVVLDLAPPLIAYMVVFKLKVF